MFWSTTTYKVVEPEPVLLCFNPKRTGTISSSSIYAPIRLSKFTVAQPNDWHDGCDKFNGCYFIVKQMPKYPPHPRCQCRLEKITKPTPYITANATCDIRKFTGYIFDEEKNNGKKKLFESWGYTIEDSEYLQQLYISQAIEKYCNGEYVYKGVEYYARIEIVIELPGNNGSIQQIKTGWSLLPKGEIKMETPFSGFAN